MQAVPSALGHEAKDWSEEGVMLRDDTTEIRKGQLLSVLNTVG